MATQDPSGPKADPTPPPKVGATPPPYAAPSYQTPPYERKRMSPAIIVLIVLAALFVPCIAVLAAIVFPVFAGAKLAAMKTATLSNSKQLNIGLLMYVNDYDDRFPPDMTSTETFGMQLDPYIRDPAVVYKTLNPKGGEFEGNTLLGGQLITSYRGREATTIMVHESVAWPDGKAATGYMDGHAKFLQFDEMRQALAATPRPRPQP